MKTCSNHGAVIPLPDPRPRAATDDEIGRLNAATNETLSYYGAAYAFQNTPAGNYAKYLLQRWREIAMRGQA